MEKRGAFVARKEVVLTLADFARFFLGEKGGSLFPAEPLFMHHKKTTDKPLFFCGAPESIRTTDLFLRREALYPAELRVPVLALKSSKAVQGYQKNTRFASPGFPADIGVNGIEFRWDPDLVARCEDGGGLVHDALGTGLLRKAVDKSRQIVRDLDIDGVFRAKRRHFLRFVRERSVVVAFPSK